MRFVIVAPTYAAVTAIMLAVSPMDADPAQAQEPSKTDDAILRQSPNLELTPEQKQTIYTSVSSKPAKETAPPTFRAAVGETVPASIDLAPLPQSVIDLIPRTKEFQYAMVTNQVLLVDASNRRIVEIISH
jgi:hypothetical protein